MSLSSVVQLVNRLFNLTAACALILMVAFVFLNVVLRYAFGTGLTWSSEAAGYLFVWVVFLGAVQAVAEHAHLRVEVLTERMPMVVQKALFVVSVGLIIVALSFLVRGLMLLIELNVGIPGPSTGLPINNYYYAALISTVLMGLIYLYQVFEATVLGKPLGHSRNTGANG